VHALAHRYELFSHLCCWAAGNIKCMTYIACWAAPSLSLLIQVHKDKTQHLPELSRKHEHYVQVWVSDGSERTAREGCLAVVN
jgi:hypothetical protein